MDKKGYIRLKDIKLKLWKFWGPATIIILLLAAGLFAGPAWGEKSETKSPCLRILYSGNLRSSIQPCG